MSKLLKNVRSLLEEEDLTKLAEKTGYSYQWLWQVSTGITKNPNVTRLEKLEEILTNGK